MPSEDLDLLQRQFPDCTTLAFADIGAGMVLVTNSDAALEQHALNRLCAEAAATLAAQGGLSPQAAMICTADEIRVILRALISGKASCCGWKGLPGFDHSHTRSLPRFPKNPV